MEEKLRLDKLQKLIVKKGLTGYLAAKDTDLRYLTGLPLEGSFAFITAEKSWLFVPGLMAQHCRDAAPWFEVKPAGFKEFGHVFKLAKERSHRTKYGFDAENIPYTTCLKLSHLGLKPIPNLIAELRIIKSAAEVKAIRKACEIACKAVVYAAKNLVKPGKREIEIAHAIEAYMWKEGARKNAFDIIVASGPNSAYPHHVTSTNKLPQTGPIIIDLGCEYEGYRSDLTRTVFLGRMTPKYKEVYQTVARAQSETIKMVRPSITASSVDASARKIIAKYGFSKYFVHGTGHGVGLDIHEPPRVTVKGKEILKTGMVITVEPGIYLPGQFGVRIEDTVLVTEKGHEVLTK